MVCRGGRVWALWRNLIGGAASARFHEKHLGFTETAQQMIRSARAVTGAIDLFTCAPHPELAQADGDNTAYCLANPGTEYVVYFTSGGAAELDISACKSGATARWFGIDQGGWIGEEEKRSGASAALQTPGPGQWAAVVRAG